MEAAIVPLTTRSLKCHADEPWSTPEDCPTFRERLHIIIGSLTQAQSGAQAIEDLDGDSIYGRLRKARQLPRSIRAVQTLVKSTLFVVRAWLGNSTSPENEL